MIHSRNIINETNLLVKHKGENINNYTRRKKLPITKNYIRKKTCSIRKAFMRLRCAIHFSTQKETRNM